MVNFKGTGNRAGTGTAHTLKLVGAIPLLLLGLAAWVVTLAGVSVIRHEAGTNNIPIYGDMGFAWFVIFGTLFVLLAALIHVAGLGLRVAPVGHSGISGLLAVFATLSMLETNKWNVLRKDIPYSTKVGKGAVTAFSGFLVLSVALALLILVLGNSPAKSRNEPAQVIQNPVSAPPPPMTSTAV